MRATLPPPSATTTSPGPEARRGRNTYIKLEGKPVVGQVRQKHWQCLVPPEGDENLVMWMTRAVEYWVLQGETYGLVMSRPVIMKNLIYGAWVVTTSARVEEILPGRRVKASPGSEIIQ